MNSASNPTRKTLTLIMLFALLAPFAAVFTYFLVHKTLAVVLVFVIVALLYFPARFVMQTIEKR